MHDIGIYLFHWSVRTAADDDLYTVLYKKWKYRYVNTVFLTFQSTKAKYMKKDVGEIFDKIIELWTLGSPFIPVLLGYDSWNCCLSHNLSDTFLFHLIYAKIQNYITEL